MKRYEDIRQWAYDRNLIEGSDPISQFLKTMSEFGELADGINKNRIEEIKDGIGDVKVTLVIIAAQLGYELERGAASYFCDLDATAKSNYLAATQALGIVADSLLAGDMDYEEDEIYCRKIIAGVLYVDAILNRIANSFELTAEQCIEHAWEEIKDRNGRMVDGVFIKEGDVEKVQS